MHKVQFTPKGTKDIAKLPKSLQNRILKKIKFFSNSENPLDFAKPLVNLPPATHRFRVGDYRITFFLEKDVLCVDRIKHRRDVYEG